MNKVGDYMQDVEKKIALLSEQLVELKRAVNGEQSLIINGLDSVHNENKEIKEQLDLVEQKLNKLIGDVSLVNEQGKLKKSYKDYTDDEILEIRNKLSVRKAASFLHCSKTTIQRICNRARVEHNKQFKEQYEQTQMIGNVILGKPVSENVEKHEDKSTIQFDDDIIDF